MERVDVFIAGGGLVGLTLSLALARAGLTVACADELDPATATSATFDGRVSAIAFASCRMLKAIGLWPRLADVAQPINDILVTDGRVSSGAASLFLHFDHREIGDEPLGHLIENRHTRIALLAAAAETQGLTLLAPVRVSRADPGPGSTRVHLADGRVFEVGVCLAADGKNSPLRRAAGIKLIAWSYRQTGIVLTVEHERPHHGIAQEYFLPGGPFAILPMVGNRSSLVWTERTQTAEALLALSEDAFVQECSRRFGDYLGAIHPIAPRWSYPLSLQLARTYIAPRLALVGDAAHAIHPIAGQGLNMGLRDVAALSEVLVDAHRLGLDIGSEMVLEGYQRWRRFDNVALALATDALNRLFANDLAPLRMARDAGLALVNRIGPARRAFMRHAGGTLSLGRRAMPKLLRGEAL